MLKLQSGKFDNPNRLFKGINKEWDSVLTNPGNVKELIPEFFQNDPTFLKNEMKLDLGIRANGKRVDDVKLPNWAHDASDFLTRHQEALESEYVSQNLNKWIDLIFGYKQRGEEAEAAHNIFHHLSYEGAVDLDKITDSLDRQAAESHIQNFGQTPSQLLVAPHPSRYAQDQCWQRWRAFVCLRSP